MSINSCDFLMPYKYRISPHVKRGIIKLFVIAGLVPAIHLRYRLQVFTGVKPAMTKDETKWPHINIFT